MTTFQKNLAFGQLAESIIGQWLRARGNLVLPVYDIEYETGKGPRVFHLDERIVAPDMVVIKASGESYWIEAKHKTVFSWHRKTRRWVTGIDLHHYRQYLRVRELSNWPVWLLFLHVESRPWGCDVANGSPDECPVGLFGGELLQLAKMESHRSDRHGASGMVYWRHEALTLIAPLEYVQKEHV